MGYPATVTVPRDVPCPASARFPDAAPDPDAALMLAFRNGSLRAFDTLVEHWRDRLVTWFFWLCHDQHVAEDCCQEVLIKLYRARGS